LPPSWVSRVRHMLRTSTTALTHAMWVVVAVVSGGNFAHAAEPTWAAECASVDEDAARLACYDSRNPPKKNAARAPSSPPSVTPDKDFGLPPTPAPATHNAEPNLVARVETVSQRLTGELLLKLDNGQSWVQATRRSTVIIKPGERVTIARGSFGGYLLSSDSGATMRVRRLQ